jgi:hypothetical protein
MKSRTVEILSKHCEWLEIVFSQLKPGDIFRLFDILSEDCTELVRSNGNASGIWRCLSLPRLHSGVLTVDCEPNVGGQHAVTSMSDR